MESETGRYIFENCQTKVSFRLDDTPARQLAGAVRDMNEDHIAELTHFAPGQCLAIVRNDIYVVNVETSPRELRAFAARSIARFKAPRAIAFCDLIGRHATGKPNYEWARKVAESATPVAGPE